MKQLLVAIICFSLTSCYSKDSKKVAALDIQTDIQKGKDVAQDDKVITGDFSIVKACTEVQVSQTAYCEYLNSGLVFKNCAFKGKVVAGYIDDAKVLHTTVFKRNIYFENCTFEDDVSFKGIAAHGTVNFHNCNFNKGAFFDGIVFHESSAFFKCHFEQDANFQGCSFSAANFNESVFMQTFSLQNSFFHENVSLNKLSCNGYTDFSLLNVYGNFYCNYTTFIKNFVLNDCSFRGRTEFLNSTFSDAQMENCLFYGNTYFQNSIFTALSLQNSNFILGEPKTDKAKITTLKMDNVTYGSGSKLLPEKINH